MRLVLLVFIIGRVLDIRGSGGTKVLSIPGDIILGGLVPVHLGNNESENACGKIDRQPGFQYLTAILFALKQINNSSTLLRNITLGTRIYDTCRSRTIGADRARDIIKETLLKNTNPLVGVLGPLVSDVSIATVQLLRVFGLPQVSFGSTSPDLSDKDLYGSFFRTVPPDSFQAQALADVLDYYEWKYLIIINSQGNWGERGAEELEKAAEQRGICIAASFSIPRLAKDKDYKNIVRNILMPEYKSVNIIVLFSTQTDSARILQSAKALGATRFTWVGSNGWSKRMIVTDGNEDIGSGAITISHTEGQVPGFRQYFLSMNPEDGNTASNPWFDEFWESELKCKLPGSTNSVSKNCTSDMKLPNMEIAPERVVVNAVYAFAHALDDMQRVFCPGESGLCESLNDELSRGKLAEILRNVSFPDSSSRAPVKFNANQEVDGSYSLMNFQQKNGVWTYVNIGAWNATRAERLLIDHSKVVWAYNKAEPAVSLCSAACPFPQIRKRRETNPRCCWDCVICLRHQLTINDTCQSCADGYSPNVNRTSCVLLPIVYPNFSEAAAIVCILLSSLGMASTLGIGAFFIKFNDHSVIKAAGKELSAIILVGIFLCYSAIYSFLAKPSVIACSFSRFISSVSYTICYAPLFMKTNRIYRIFNRAQKTASRPHFISPTSQVLITMGLITIQVLITAVWTISSTPSVDYKYEEIQRTILQCRYEGKMLVLNLIYNLLLMLACTLFAFKTRNFPRNFNESKYIGIMMYLTCAVWIIYLPSYLNTSDTFIKVYFNCGVFILNGTITLVGLFGPKVYVVFTRNQEVVASAPQSTNPEFNRIPATRSPGMDSQASQAAYSRVNEPFSQHVQENHSPRNSLFAVSPAKKYLGSSLSISSAMNQRWSPSPRDRTQSRTSLMSSPSPKPESLEVSTLEDAYLAKNAQPIKINVTPKNEFVSP